ncbi:MarR family winged helix-turn-helix transcriptional regulator [Lachnospiraceae bacterium LCP25S3_G4]
MEDIKSVGLMVKSINNVYEKDLNKKLKTIGITASQCAVLNYLFHTKKEFVNQRDIEYNLNLRNPTVTGLLKRLDQKGFILCVQNTSDKRCKNIYLTEKAYDIQKRMENDRKKMDKVLLRGMTKKEAEAFRRALSKVLDNI